LARQNAIRTRIGDKTQNSITGSMRSRGAERSEKISQKIIHAFYEWGMDGDHAGGITHSDKGIAEAAGATDDVYWHQHGCSRSRDLCYGLRYCPTRINRSGVLQVSRCRSLTLIGIAAIVIALSAAYYVIKRLRLPARTEKNF